MTTSKIVSLIAPPKTVAKTLLATISGPQMYIGSCKTGSFLISDVLGYVRSVQLQTLGTNIHKKADTSHTTLVIAITTETDYNELERLNHLFQSGLDYRIMILIDPKEYHSGRMPSSAFSRLLPYRSPMSEIPQPDVDGLASQDDGPPDRELHADASIINLLHHMTFDPDAQTLHFSSRFQEYVETLVAGLEESHILITFEIPKSMATLCLDEYDAICLTLTYTGKLALYGVDLTSLNKRLSFRCVVSDLPKPNRLNALLNTGQLGHYSNTIPYDCEITDYTIDVVLSGTPNIEKNAQGHYTLKTLPTPKNICVASRLDPESVNKLADWLTEDPTRRCGVHRFDSIGLAVWNPPSSPPPKPYPRVPIKTVLQSKLTEYDQTRLFENGGDDASNRPILIVTPGDIALCRMHILNAPHRHFMITESAYATVTEYGHFGSIHHLSLVTEMDLLAADILKIDPTLEPYLSPTVLVRVAWLQSTGCRLHDAIQQGILNGLPTREQTAPRHHVATYFYAERGIWAFDPTQTPPTFSALSDIGNQTDLRVGCVTPIGLGDVSLSRALDAGGCFRVPMWVNGHVVAPVDTLSDQTLDTVCAQLPDYFIVGSPQKDMIGAVYSDLKALAQTSRPITQGYISNIRLLIGESGTGKDEIARLSPSLYPESEMVFSDVFNPLFVDQYIEWIRQAPQDGPIQLFNFQEINLTEDHIEAFERVAIAAISCPNVYLLVTANDYASRAPLSLTLQTLCRETKVGPLTHSDMREAINQYVTQYAHPRSPEPFITTINRAVSMTALKDKINFRLIRLVCETVTKAERPRDAHDYLNTLFEIQLPEEETEPGYDVIATSMPHPSITTMPHPIHTQHPEHTPAPPRQTLSSGPSSFKATPIKQLPPAHSPVDEERETALKTTYGMSHGHGLTLLAWRLSVLMAVLALIIDRYLYPYTTFKSGKHDSSKYSANVFDTIKANAPKTFIPPYQIPAGSNALDCRYLTSLPTEQMVLYAPARGKVTKKVEQTYLGRVTGTHWSHFFKELPSTAWVDWRPGGHLWGISNISALSFNSDIQNIPKPIANANTSYPFVNTMIMALNYIRLSDFGPPAKFDQQINLIRAFYAHYFQYDRNANHFYPSTKSDSWIDDFLTYRIGTCAHFSDFAQMLLPVVNPDIPVMSASLAGCGEKDTHRGLLAAVNGMVGYWDVTISRTPTYKKDLDVASATSHSESTFKDVLFGCFLLLLTYTPVFAISYMYRKTNTFTDTSTSLRDNIVYRGDTVTRRMGEIFNAVSSETDEEWIKAFMVRDPSICIPEKKRKIGILAPHKPGPKDWARWLMVTHSSGYRAITQMSSQELRRLNMSIPTFLQLCRDQGVDFRSVTSSELAQKISPSSVKPHEKPVHFKQWTVEGHPEWGHFSASTLTEVPQKLEVFLNSVIRLAKNTPLDTIYLVDHRQPDIKMSLSGLALLTRNDALAADLYFNRGVTWGYRRYDKEGGLSNDISTYYLLLLHCDHVIYTKNVDAIKSIRKRLYEFPLHPGDMGFREYDTGTLKKSISPLSAAIEMHLLGEIHLDQIDLASDPGIYASFLDQKTEGSLLTGYKVFKSGQLVMDMSPLFYGLQGVPLGQKKSYSELDWLITCGVCITSSLSPFLIDAAPNPIYMPLLSYFSLLALRNLSIWTDTFVFSETFPRSHPSRVAILQRLIEAGAPVTTDTGYRLFHEGKLVLSKPSVSIALNATPTLIDAGYPLLENVYSHLIDPKDGKKQSLSCIVENIPQYNECALMYHIAKAYVTHMVGGHRAG